MVNQSQRPMKRFGYALSTTVPFLALTLLALVTSGCLVEVQDDDPAGNADVFAFTLVFSMDDASIAGNVASVPFRLPEVTPNVVDNGAVLVYFREQGTWTALPYTFAVESDDLQAVDYTITLGYAYRDQLLEVFYEASSEDIILDTQPNRDVKVVIIDALPFGKQAPDFSDYESVKAYYDL